MDTERLVDAGSPTEEDIEDELLAKRNEVMEDQLTEPRGTLEALKSMVKNHPSAWT